MRLLACLVAVGTPACGAGADGSAAPLGLATGSDGGRCTVVSQRSSGPRSLDLALPAPCRFSTEADGTVRVVSEGRYRYVVVEAEESRQKEKCVTIVTSIRLEGEQWMPSRVQDRVAACPGTRWDAAIFGGLFR